MKPTDGTRRGIIGIYTDRVALSVVEKQGEGYSIYRKQEERDFVTKEGKLNVSSLIEGILEMGELAGKICCDEILCQGYGLLRYHQGLAALLKQKLPFPVQEISGIQQGSILLRQVFPKGMGDDAAGFWSGDMSTQLVWQENHQHRIESLPLGWRLLSQEGVLIPNRIGEERMRQQIRTVFRGRGIRIKEKKSILLAAGLEQMTEFLLWIGGSCPGEISITKETLESVMRLMRKESLNCFPALERASELFPQKIFCQLMILRELMELTGADRAKTSSVRLEDQTLEKGISRR